MWPNEHQSTGKMGRQELEAWIRRAEQTGFLEDENVLASSDDTAPALNPGDVIGGFQIIQLIGSGGRSVVFRASQLSVAGREVALKVYRHGDDAVVDDSAAVEVQALATLDHPNLARIIDAGFTPAGGRYVAMSLLAGVPIDQYCDACQRTGREIAQLIRRVCGAVDVLHRRGIIHCDLKPSNILVDDAGQPAVTDFDASQYHSNADPLRRGTVGYIAPEQLAVSRYLQLNSGDAVQEEQHRPDAASDIYGIGAVLYRCLTGQVLFAGHSASGALMATLFDSPQPPSSVRSAIDADLEAICLRCLRKSPDDRYLTIAALIADLDAYVDAAKATNASKIVGRRAWPALMLTAVLGVALLLHSVFGPESWLSGVSNAPTERVTAMPGLLPPTIDKTDVWQLETRDPRPGFQYSQLDPAKDRIAVMGNDCWLRIYSVHATSLSLESMLSMDHPTHTTYRGISWHPDGDQIVACAGDSCAIIWSVGRCQRLARLSAPGAFNIIRDAQWCPDGRAIALACRSGIVQVYDAAGNLKRQFQGHRAEALRVRWSPDGRRIASGDVTGAVYVWDSESLEVEQVIRRPPNDRQLARSIWAVDWHPDGDQVAFGNRGGDVTVIECESGEAMELGNLGSSIYSLDWTRDGRLFAGCKQLVVHSAATGWEAIDQGMVDGVYESLEWDERSSRLYTSGRQGRLERWNVARKTRDVLGMSNSSIVRDLAWSPDGTLLASAGSDGCVRLLDKSGDIQALTERTRSIGGVQCVSWHPTQQLLACGNGEGGRGVDIYQIELAGDSVPRDETVRNKNAVGTAFEVAPGNTQVTVRLLATVLLKEASESVVWSATGDYLIVGDSRGGLRVVRTRDWKVVWVAERQVHATAIESLDVSVDNRIASGDVAGQLVTWRLSDSGDLQLLDDSRYFEYGVTDVAFDSTGERLAVSDRHLEVFLLDSRTFDDLWKRSVVAPARPGQLAWSPDNRHIACGNFGMLSSFDGLLVDPAACNQGGCVAWHPNDVIVTGSWQGELEFHDGPDYQIRSRSLQLAGGITVTVPAAGVVPEALERPSEHLRWIHQPSAGRYLVTSARGHR